MESASQLLYAHFGSPRIADARDLPEFACWVCGGMSVRGADVDRWMGSNFTGQNKALAPMSTHVCEACVHCMQGRPPDAWCGCGSVDRMALALLESAEHLNSIRIRHIVGRSTDPAKGSGVRMRCVVGHARHIQCAPVGVHSMPIHWRAIEARA